MQPIPDQAVKLLEGLATKLGTTIEYLWSICVKQAYIEAWINLSGIIAFCIILYLMFTKGKPRINKNRDDYDRPILLFIFWFFVGAFSMTMFFMLNEAITGFFNPEFQALKYILNHLK